MEGFITFLFFLVLFGWIMGKLFPIILAWVIKRKKKKGQMNGGFTGFGWNSGTGFAGFNVFQQQQEPYAEKKHEGKVIISDIPKQEKVIDKEVGEYVDFEEK
jgi:hypothetical protein